MLLVKSTSYLLKLFFFRNLLFKRFCHNLYILFMSLFYWWVLSITLEGIKMMVIIPIFWPNVPTVKPPASSSTHKVQLMMLKRPQGMWALTLTMRTKVNWVASGQIIATSHEFWVLKCWWETLGCWNILSFGQVASCLIKLPTDTLWYPVVINDWFFPETNHRSTWKWIRLEYEGSFLLGCGLFSRAKC